MSKITTVNVTPRSIGDTNRVEWELNIPPNVQGYSVESITGYCFNQCWIEPEDKISIIIKLTPLFKFEYIDNQDEFGGIFTTFDEMKMHDIGDNFSWCYLVDSDNTYARWDKIRGEWHWNIKMKEYGEWAGDFDTLEELMEADGDYGVVINEEGLKEYKKEDGLWIINPGVDTTYDYCGIILGNPNQHNFGKFIEPDHGDWCYSRVYETIWIYNEDTELWENTLARTTVTPLRRLYKLVWDPTDDTPMYDDIFPEEGKRFNLHEISRLDGITISPWKDIYNEYMDIDTASNITKLRHPPNPLALHKSALAMDFDRPEGIDYSRYYFRTSWDDGRVDYEYLRELPLTYNSNITTAGRRKIAGGVGFQETKGSSIFDSFMQRLNLHIQAATYEYFIRSDDDGVMPEHEETEYSFYYRFMDYIKFASAESSYQNNYISWINFHKIEEAPETYRLVQEFMTGSGDFASSSDIWEQRFMPKLVKTESLKLGGSDVRIVYPISLMYEQPMTWGLYKEIYATSLLSVYEERTPDIFSKDAIENVDRFIEFDSVRILATRGISFQMFGRDIGWNADMDSDDGTQQKGPFLMEAESLSLLPGIEKYIFKVTCPTFGFFNLWSLQLYVKANDSTNIDSILNYNVNKSGSGPLTSLTNIAFKFTQTSPGYLWLSNSLPHSKIPVGHNRKIIFELLDMYGRKIPLRDVSTGVHIGAGLEVYLYHEDPPDTG